jgi:hypothetical protein
VTLSHFTIDELGEETISWMVDRLDLVLVGSDSDGTEWRPADSEGK